MGDPGEDALCALCARDATPDANGSTVKAPCKAGHDELYHATCLDTYQKQLGQQGVLAAKRGAYFPCPVEGCKAKVHRVTAVMAKEGKKKMKKVQAMLEAARKAADDRRKGPGTAPAAAPPRPAAAVAAWLQRQQQQQQHQQSSDEEEDAGPRAAPAPPLAPGADDPPGADAIRAPKRPPAGAAAAAAAAVAAAAKASAAEAALPGWRGREEPVEHNPWPAPPKQPAAAAAAPQPAPAAAPWPAAPAPQPAALSDHPTPWARPGGAAAFLLKQAAQPASPAQQFPPKPVPRPAAAAAAGRAPVAPLGAAGAPADADGGWGTDGGALHPALAAHRAAAGVNNIQRYNELVGATPGRADGAPALPQTAAPPVLPQTAGSSAGPAPAAAARFDHWRQGDCGPAAGSGYGGAGGDQAGEAMAAAQLAAIRGRDAWRADAPPAAKPRGPNLMEHWQQWQDQRVQREREWQDSAMAPQAGGHQNGHGSQPAGAWHGGAAAAAPAAAHGGGGGGAPAPWGAAPLPAAPPPPPAPAYMDASALSALSAAVAECPLPGGGPGDASDDLDELITLCGM
ncbi:hypothetical protein Rsub_02700 [Raphidocelis subcapitata]|uniref:Uncharacterized protein n=1 Tax=Raphidocelis subcapitata TaxID=307507 RepID=A0A2V0NQT0_9CHLO|nr:hypothetical protein Rsub_02700 [Raphidocelis subcapitata]|eukprot:GBF89994.1 hypothetical protein Rsub_02700 [Raphidocelis subcapitata]